MVTEYILSIPCSYCGKQIEKHIKTFCSGACKVRAHRDGHKKEEKLNVTSELQEKITVTPRLQQKPIDKPNVTPALQENTGVKRFSLAHLGGSSWKGENK